MRFFLLLAAALLLFSTPSTAQDRAASPRGEASTQIDGNWIVVDYGRPILRNRADIFNMGDSYGEFVLGDAPVWRVGANKATRMMTEKDLMFGDQHLPAGDYAVFVDLKDGEWKFILSNHVTRAEFRSEEPGLWGSFGYLESEDALRMDMEMGELPWTVDQFTISFIDVSDTAGTLALMWDNTMATVAFSVMN